MEKISENYDLVMILGAGIIESRRRAEYASKIIENYKNKIILTGGIPKKISFIQDPKEKSEADIMEEILCKHSINKKRIFKEAESQNTLENFVKSKNIIKDFNVKNIAIIDGLAHIKRSLKTAEEIMPEYNFKGFPVPITYGNIFINFIIEGISKILETSYVNSKKYRFYNNY